MSNLDWFPDDPIHLLSHQLLNVNRLREGFFNVDGIEPTPRTRQFLMVGRGRRILRDLGTRGGVLRKIGDHLDFDPGSWRDSCVFLNQYMRAFLTRCPDKVITVQVVPRRRTYKTFALDAKKGKPQLVKKPKFVLPSAFVQGTDLELAYGIRLPGIGLLMEDAPMYNERTGEAEERWWTKVRVTRHIPGVRKVYDTRFFMARKSDRKLIRRSGNPPALVNYFRNDVQESPIVCVSSIDPEPDALHNQGLQTHCFSLDGNSGRVLDLRQSDPTFRYHCEGATHNLSGMGRLLNRDNFHL